MKLQPARPRHPRHFVGPTRWLYLIMLKQLIEDMQSTQSPSYPIHIHPLNELLWSAHNGSGEPIGDFFSNLTLLSECKHDLLIIIFLDSIIL
jgi:hypothetical protein